MSEAKLEKKPTIFEAIPLITGAIEPITKRRDAPAVVGGYKFRGIDDVYAALNLLLAKYGVSILPEILESKHEQAGTSAKGTVMWRHSQRVRFHLRATDGSEVTADAEGEGLDSGDKAVPKCASTAYKSMAFQVFCIPTGEKVDAEEDSPEVEAQPHKNGTAKPAAKPAPAKDDPSKKLSEEHLESLKACHSQSEIDTIRAEIAADHAARKMNDAQFAWLEKAAHKIAGNLKTVQENAA